MFPVLSVILDVASVGLWVIMLCVFAIKVVRGVIEYETVLPYLLHFLAYTGIAPCSMIIAAVLRTPQEASSYAVQFGGILLCLAMVAVSFQAIDIHDDVSARQRERITKHLPL